MAIRVYGEQAVRTHENQMLQHFLEALEGRWATSADWIYVVANTIWNGAEIDVVVILPKAILVADLKSHSGRLTGTENGPWQANGILVKGGRKTNPYQQLRDNRFSVMDWLRSQTLLSGRNLGHVSAGVLFSGDVDDHLEISPKARTWFHVTAVQHCATLLDRLASPELYVEQRDALEIIQKLGAQPLEWTSKRPRLRDLDKEDFDSQPRASMTELQQEALQALKSFVDSDELATFSVLGMISTGKSRLLAEAACEITKRGKKAIVLAPNRRLADRAMIESDSIYAHLYEIGIEDGKGAAEKTVTPAVIPMRLCSDEPDCVYLLDDAHLLGNSKFTTPDGKQYGSGHLLDDFRSFSELGKGKRKAIFFGDPYQIQRSGDDESVLSGGFQKNRGLKHQSLELAQIIDTSGGSAKLANAERLVKAIRAKRFAELDLVTDDGFRHAQDQQDAATQMLERFRSDPFSTWYLAKTNAKARYVAQWVRERLHGKKPLASLEPGDLLEIFVSPKPQRNDLDDPSWSSHIPSGSRWVLAAIGNTATVEQRLKGRPNPIQFHSVQCHLEGGGQIPLNVLEEFLIAEKPELNSDIATAIKVWREKESKLGKTPPEFTYARYGYAATVHHAQGMSTPICYVDCDFESDCHSEGYFRWLYSALCVAEREIVLVNFAAIHLFDRAIWRQGPVSVASDIPAGAGWSFVPHRVVPQGGLPPGLDQSLDAHKSVAICLKIVNVTEKLGWRIVKATCHPYLEQYDLVGPKGKPCKIKISYNDKNIVTAMHVIAPEHWPLLADVAADCLATNDYSPEAKSLLQSARARVGRGGWKVVSAMEGPYRLTVTMARSCDEYAIIEINFDGQGLASTLRPLKCSKSGLLEAIRGVLL